MFHFQKKDETFSRFASELRIANEKLLNLKNIGVDLESAIYNGFKTQFPNVKRLLCVRHLSQRDESKLIKLTTQHKQSEFEQKALTKRNFERYLWNSNRFSPRTWSV